MKYTRRLQNASRDCLVTHRKMMKGLSLCDLWHGGDHDERCGYFLTFVSRTGTFEHRDGGRTRKGFRTILKTTIRRFAPTVSITPVISVWGDYFIDSITAIPVSRNPHWPNSNSPLS